MRNPQVDVPAFAVERLLPRVVAHMQLCLALHQEGDQSSLSLSQLVQSSGADVFFLRSWL